MAGQTTVPRQTRGTPATVSIVIPCHNYGRFLAEAIESALAQTMPAHEIILIDDGSTDDSLAVARRFAHLPQVRVIGQPNQGAVATFNTGVRLSTGDLFVILSADDRLDPRYLERTVPVLIRDHEAAYAYTAYRMFGARQRVLPALPFNPMRLALRPYVSGTALMRRRAFDQVGGFSTDMHGGHEDWDYFVALAQLGWHGVPVPEVLLHYRQHSNSSRNAIRARQWFRVRTLIYRRHPDLYHVPLLPFLCLAVLNDQYLRARAVPRALARRFGPDNARGGDRRVCLLGKDRQSGTRYQRLQSYLAASEIRVASLRLQPHLGRSTGGWPSRRGTYAGRRTWRRVIDFAHFAAAATYQRATVYHATDLPSFAAGVVAASANRSALVYEPDCASRATGKPQPCSFLSTLLERLFLLRVDAVLASNEDTAEDLRVRLMAQSIILEYDSPVLQPPGCTMCTGTPVQGVDDLRLVQLYRDLLPIAKPPEAPAGIH